MLTAGAPDPLVKPDLKALFLGFSSVGLSGFGGVLPFARRMLVEERRWMTAEEFNAQFKKDGPVWERLVKLSGAKLD